MKASHCVKELKIKNEKLYNKFSNAKIGVLVQNKEQLLLIIAKSHEIHKNLRAVYYSENFPCIVEESFKEIQYGHISICQFYDGYSIKMTDYKKESFDFDEIFEIVYKEYNLERILELVNLKWISIDDFTELLNIDINKKYTLENIDYKGY